jgi:hypothetical protein
MFANKQVRGQAKGIMQLPQREAQPQTLTETQITANTLTLALD